MKNLVYLNKLLLKLESEFKGDFFIPEVWNCFGYEDFKTCADRPSEISVNPYSFSKHSIKKILSAKYSLDTPLDKSIIYGMLPRMFTAWDHHKKDSICPGTFLKCIWLLPYLKKMNVDIVYLLPIFEVSNKYKKGEIGCPYAIKDIYALDENLHDPLLGEHSKELLETQFKAFVEACHLFGIKVMLDFAFRTVARDNVLTVTHPEWFYWIDKKHDKAFKAPHIPALPSHTPVSLEVLEDIYKAKNTAKYLKMFTLPGEHATTAPGFSDVINDTQPAWSDTTYLKFYFDTPKESAKYIPKDQVPYILYDAIKLNVLRGKKPNQELWEYVKGVIPYYQTKFGIDGARIDMGHALPPLLTKQIIAAARESRPEFILWSEVLDPALSMEAKKQGYNFISGDLWAVYKSLGKDLSAHTMHSQLPMIGAFETPDTPRIAVSWSSREQLYAIMLANFFLPNTIPFINNGMDVLEVQPMNLGLGNTKRGQYVLPKSDPMYGKLAFFDNYRLHWLNTDAKWMFNTLCEISSLKKSCAGIDATLTNRFISAILVLLSKKKQ